MDQIACKCFDNYEIGLYDEMFDTDGSIKPHWQDVYDYLQNLDEEKLASKNAEIDWQLSENGVTYNIYEGEQKKRKWQLDPIPFVMDAKEWNSLKVGLQQRAMLLNLIFKDLYGEQKLLQEGIVPAEILYNDTHFIREMKSFSEDYFNLDYYALDISRGPDGKFWVISDKTESPSGLGYAIENRLTLNSVDGDLVENVNIHKLAEFIEGLKQTLLHQHTATQDPFIIMLSPGPYNETYFEQSYLSSILGCELVQGDDLLVKDSCLYLKNLTGLKKVDVVIRRLDDVYCDPLELRNDSQLGVPGLVDVLRKQNVKMINPIGIGVLENPALNPFMNNICMYFFDQELIIPQIATWWCGQKNERDYVFEHLDDLIIKSIHKSSVKNIFVGSELNSSQKKSLKTMIEQNPYTYIAQEKIEFSTIPSFSSKEIEARKNALRLFAYKNNNEYKFMNGGLVRISSHKDAFIVSNQKGGGSKDLWVINDLKTDAKESKSYDLLCDTYDNSIMSLTTKKAENIFWLGRYLQRAIITARIIRLYLKYTMRNNRSNPMTQEAIRLFAQSITHLTMTYPGFLQEDTKESQEILRIIKDIHTTGSFSFTISILSNVHMNIKNLLSHECRKVYEKLQDNWDIYLESQSTEYTQHAIALDEVLIYLNAYKELIRESISKEQGLIFYEIGEKFEMAVLLLSKIRSLTTVKQQNVTEQEILQFLLHSNDSFNSFKSMYKSSMSIESVLEFLLLRNDSPKSLISIVKSLMDMLDFIYQSTLIKSHFDGSEQYIYDVYSKLKSLKLETLLQSCDDTFIYCELEKFLSGVTQMLTQFSNEFTKNYFSHYYE